MTYLEWPRRIRALGQFRVTDLDQPVLSSDDEHHLRHVLRARDGEEVVLTNGQGSWVFGAVRDYGIERLGDVRVDPERRATTLYLAPLKGDRSEWAVAKATELGVSRIVPLLSEHVVVKFKGESRAKTLSRWRRIGNESAGQCRRTYDVVIDEPVEILDVPLDVAIADFDGGPDWRGVRAVCIGPEGGWSPRELDQSRRRLSLGPSVLRAETAGVVAASILAFGAGEWGFTAGAGSNE